MLHIAICMLVHLTMIMLKSPPGAGCAIDALSDQLVPRPLDLADIMYILLLYRYTLGKITTQYILSVKVAITVTSSPFFGGSGVIVTLSISA